MDISSRHEVNVPAGVLVITRWAEVPAVEPLAEPPREGWPPGLLVECTLNGKEITVGEAESLIAAALGLSGEEHREHTVSGPGSCRRCQLLRDNAWWMEARDA